MDVATRRCADGARSLLANEGESLLPCGAVVKPPHVMRFPADGGNAAERDRIGDTAAQSATANVPQLDSLVPQRRDEDSISYVDIVDERASHLRGENLLRRGGIRDVDDDESRRRPTRRIDAKKCVEPAAYALDFRGMHSRIRERRGVTRDQLRLRRICQIVNHYRAGRELRRHNQELSVVTRLDVAKCPGVVHDHRVDKHRRIAGNVPDLDGVAGGRSKSPRRGVGIIAPDIYLGGVSVGDDPHTQGDKGRRSAWRRDWVVGTAREHD